MSTATKGKAKPLTYGDLPARSTSIRTVEGRQISGYPIVLFCPSCGEQYSATRGDYWDRTAQKVICAYDGTPMVLATSRSLMIQVSPETAAKLTQTIKGSYKENPGYQLPGIVDVLQRCYAVIKEGEAPEEHHELLEELRILGMGYPHE